MTTSEAYTDDARTQVPSRAESWAIAIYEQINNSRLLLGLIVMAALTAISITFNYIIGSWTASDPSSAALLPKGYALLDIALIFLCTMLAVGITSVFLRLFTAIWVVFLLALSLWACASFIVAVDSRGNSTATDQKIEQLKSNITEAEKRVASWQAKLDNTKSHHTHFDGKLKEAEANRDAYQNELAELERENPPPALMIFKRFEHLVPMTEDTFRFLVRITWGAALIITPLLCMAIIASEVKQMMAKFRQSGENSLNCSALLCSAESQNYKRGSEGHKAESKVNKIEDETRYQEIKQKVQSGALKPTSRKLKAAGISSEYSLIYLRRMCREGVIERVGRGYRLKQSLAVA